MQKVELLVSLIVPAVDIDLGDASLICILGDAKEEPLQIPVLQCWDAALRDTKQWRAAWRGSGARSAWILLSACFVPLLPAVGAVACAATSTCASSALCHLFAAVVGVCIGLFAWWLFLRLLMHTRVVNTILFAVHNECAFGIHRGRFGWHTLHPPVPVRYLETANSTHWISRLTVRDAQQEQLALAVVHLPLAAFMWETVACRTLSALPYHGGVIIMTNPHGLDLHEYIFFFTRSGMRAVPAMGTYLLFVFSDPRVADVNVVESNRTVRVKWVMTTQQHVPPQQEEWGCVSNN